MDALRGGWGAGVSVELSDYHLIPDPDHQHCYECREHQDLAETEHRNTGTEEEDVRFS